MWLQLRRVGVPPLARLSQLVRLTQLTRLTLLVLCVVSAPSVSLAQASGGEAGPKKVVVQSFVGPRAAGLRSALVNNLETAGGIVVVPQDEVVQTAGSLNIHRRVLKENEYTIVARPLGVSAFLSGRVTRSRRGWALLVTVRNAATGSVLGSSTWSGQTFTGLNAVRTTAFRRLNGYLDAAQPPAAQPPAALAPAEPSTSGEGTTAGSEATGQASPGTGPSGADQGTSPGETPAPSTGQAAAQDSTQGDGKEAWYQQGEVEAPDEQGIAIDPEGVEGEATYDYVEYDPEAEYLEGAYEEVIIEVDRHPWAHVRFTGGAVRRSLNATALVFNNGRDPSGTNLLTEERQYKSAGLGHMEIGLEAEIYPWSAGKQQKMNWFGLVAGFRQSLFLSSETCRRRDSLSAPCTTDDVLTVPTNQMEVFGGARLRFRLGYKETDPKLKFDLGYGMFAFTFDRQTLLDVDPQRIVPPLRYSYLNFGTSLQFQVVPTYLDIIVGGAYRQGLSVGTDALQIWGTETSGFTGFDFNIELRSDAPYLGDGVYYGLRVDVFQFRTLFKGQAVCLVPGGACTGTDPWEPWPYDGEVTNVTGGFQTAVPDNYLRTSLVLGYRFD